MKRGVRPVELKRKTGDQGGRVGAGAGIAKVRASLSAPNRAIWCDCDLRFESRIANH